MEADRPTRGDGAVEPLSVLIADDDVSFRASVREALTADGFLVVGTAGDAVSAIALASRLRPEICLIEFNLQNGGPYAIGRIAKASPKTMIIVLTTSDRREDVVDACARGAHGYLLKGISGDRLASTLRAARAGEPALPRSLVPYLVDEIRRSSERRIALPSGDVLLTPREWSVGELLRHGSSTAEIADRLGVSPVTVRRHVGLLLRKLGAENREAAVRLLRAYGRR
jgi:DNA-binding NarL/FixJ family response regulator